MDYNRLANSVAKQLAAYGQAVLLRQYAEGSAEYDPSSLGVSADEVTPVETTRMALVTEQPGKRIGPQYGTSNETGTLITQGQKWIYLDALGTTPHPNDKVVIGDVEYTILDVQETSPSGIPVFYLIVLKR